MDEDTTKDPFLDEEEPIVPEPDGEADIVVGDEDDDEVSMWDEE